MIKYTLLLSLTFLTYLASAQKIDQKLTAKIKQEIVGFKGEIGIYIHHLKKNTTVSIAADSIFPTASIVKVPILVGVFNKTANGELQLDHSYRYDTARVYGGSGLMQFYKDSAQTDLSTLISLMLTYSDNVASIWLQELAGGGETINSILDQLGLQATRVNSRTAGRSELWKKYGWGQTSPREMATLFSLIRAGHVIDKRHAEKMYRYLKNQFYNERSLSQIPPHINTISKTGSVDDARGEVVLVNAPSGDYVFCILTKNNKDQSWDSTNEAENLTRKLSHIIWNYYEPKQPYEAPEKIK